MQRKNSWELVKKIYKPRHTFFFISFALILSLLLIDFFRGEITHYLFFSDVNGVSSIIQNFGVIAPLIFVIIVTLEVMIAPIPGFIIYITGGVLFGWFLGGLLTLTANMIGASFAFFLANYLGREYVEKKVSDKKWHKFDRYAEKYGGYAIFFLRINPFTSSDIFSYLAGFSKMRFRSFFLGTFFGLLPLSFLQTYFGKSLVEASPLLYWVFLIVSVLYLAGTIWLIYIGTSNRKK
ncbi:TVP38/TMEM64 family protein [Candidatus Woesearchaeota archaeon]|nr:TVP38/TMEM64 family protein [Candidatus Woesearchaeota archaeon]